MLWARAVNRHHCKKVISPVIRAVMEKCYHLNKSRLTGWIGRSSSPLNILCVGRDESTTRSALSPMKLLRKDRVCCTVQYTSVLFVFIFPRCIPLEPRKPLNSSQPDLNGKRPCMSCDCRPVQHDVQDPLTKCRASSKGLNLNILAEGFKQGAKHTLLCRSSVFSGSRKKVPIKLN